MLAIDAACSCLGGRQKDFDGTNRKQGPNPDVSSNPTTKAHKPIHAVQGNDTIGQVVTPVWRKTIQ